MEQEALLRMEEAVNEIRRRMDAAAREAGRSPAAVKLCAACKTRTPDVIAESAKLAIDLFGENHVQELVRNADAGAYLGKPVHVIGHLQTNKIKKVLGRADMIQSIDSIHILQEVNAAAEKLGLRQNILLEVNIGEEEAKTGILPSELPALAEAAAGCGSIHVCGLMAIPPVNDDDAENRRQLAKVRELAFRIAQEHYSNMEMDILSMGMSDDYENAIREGATIVRIGTAIYGARDYSRK